MSDQGPHQATEAVTAEMMNDVLETVEDRLEDLAAILADARASSDTRREALRAFTGTIHSLKGLVRAFGMHKLASLCHRLEDRLVAQSDFDDRLIALAGDIVHGLRDLAQDGLLNDQRLMDQLSHRLNRAA